MHRPIVAVLLACGLLTSSSAVVAAPSGGALPPPLELEVFVAGNFGVPVDAVAVALNVTAASPLAAGFVTAYPCVGELPGVSNLNFAADQDVPNSVLVRLSDEGSVCVATSATTDVIIDLNGYVPAGSSLTLLDAPTRALDTRNGTGAPQGRVAADGVVVLDVRPVVPVGSTTVVLNATAVGPDAAGFETVYPCDQPRPATSTLNYPAGRDVPNLAVARVAADGTVCFHTTAGAHLLADVTGYIASPGSGVVTLTNPERVVDTRSGLGGPASPVTGAPRSVQIHGVAGVPDSASMVLANVTSTRAVAAGFATVYPCGVAVPEVSNLNFVPGSDAANAALLKIGAGGAICATASVATDLIVDVVGYVEGADDLVPLDPQRIYDSRRDAQAECSLAIAEPFGNTVTVTDLRTLTSKTHSWPTLRGDQSSLPIPMAVLPTCDGFVAGVRELSFGPFAVWEFRFGGASRRIGPGFEIFNNSYLHVRQDGHVLALKGGSTATVYDVTTETTLAGTSVPPGETLAPLGVLFDELYVYEHLAGGPNVSASITVIDAGGLAWTEALPSGANPYGTLMYSPTGSYLLSSVQTSGGSIGTSRMTITFDGIPIAFEDPAVGSNGSARWLAEGVVITCGQGDTDRQPVYRWSIFAAPELLPIVGCPAAVR